jgi:3-deoxy-D-manno-octulosonate 8-phosphate phosphatase (KDO 8-P phosphatase)
VDVVRDLFEHGGGEFLSTPTDLRARLQRVRALVFDWDGVFTDGRKGEGGQSTFNESDAMGTNLLRFSLWRPRGELPVAAIITGEENPAALRLAQREHFHSVYLGVKDKPRALEHLLAAHSMLPLEVAFVFDDVLDLAVARLCGARFMVRRGGSAMMAEYVRRHGLADYVTGQGPGDAAVREVCELVMGLAGSYEDVVDARLLFAGEYETYLAARQQVVTAGHRAQGRDLVPVTV